MKKEQIKKIIFSFLIIFLFFFMLLIFGPAEIFFANATEFEFVYGEFAGFLAFAALAASLVLCIVCIVLPEKISGVILSLLFGISLSGYIQIMFLNQNLDILGANAEGFTLHPLHAVIDSVVWLAVLGATISLFALKRDIWRKLIGYCTVFLLGVQLVAFVSLFFSASEGAFRHVGGEEWHLSADEQYTVSANENIIVIILDGFASIELNQAREAVPGLEDCLHDFTYYSNADCNYYGTFPSLVHTFSGNEFDMSVSSDEWMMRAWSDEDTKEFYNMLHEKNFKTNMYTSDILQLCGTNDPVILNGIFSNLKYSSRNIDVFYKLLFKTITKMSCYRMAPDVLKNLFYTDGVEYEDIIVYVDEKIDHENFDFYQSLLDRKLTVDSKSNYLMIQHLTGPHDYTTGADGFYKADATLTETIEGCMTVLEEFFDRLREAGVYDSSTIIVTSDHGSFPNPQMIFYIKGKNVLQDQLNSNNTPITLSELLPTIAYLAGDTSGKWGPTIYDFSEDEVRERTYWRRDSLSDYPIVKNFTGERDGIANIYKGYTYTGSQDELMQKMQNDDCVIVPMVDSFY